MMGIKRTHLLPATSRRLARRTRTEVNFYRRLEERLEFSFVRELVEDHASPSFAEPYAFTDTEGCCRALFLAQEMGVCPDGWCHAQR